MKDSCLVHSVQTGKGCIGHGLKNKSLASSIAQINDFSHFIHSYRFGGVWDRNFRDQDSLKVSLWLNFVPAINWFPFFSIEDFSKVMSLKTILQILGKQK